MQPEGPSFELAGNRVRWQGWSFRIGFTAREGLVLHAVAYEDGGRARSILHRASFCEMAVPYGDPANGRHIHSPFDIGENLVGTLANSLTLGCDCLGEIRYLDAVVVRPTAGRRSSRGRSACTRRTAACSGSTGTSAPTTPRSGARAGS